MDQYTEIIALGAFTKNTTCSIERLKPEMAIAGLTPIYFNLKSKNVLVLVDDEYNDLDVLNPLLHLELVLRELSALKEELDFLSWCKALGLNANDSKLLTYYSAMISEHIPYLEKTIHPLHLSNFVSDLDFQLNSGAAQALRQLRTAKP